MCNFTCTHFTNVLLKLRIYIVAAWTSQRVLHFPQQMPYGVGADQSSYLQAVNILDASALLVEMKWPLRK